MRSFLSPYGDGTGFRGNKVVKFRFSPPYGDGPKSIQIRGAHMFSPPYGGGTNITTVDSRSDQFSPPYGDGTMMFVYNMFHSLFSPPYGEKLKSGTKTLMAWQRSFCPLTGIVQTL